MEKFISQAERVLNGWIFLPGKAEETFVGKGIPNWKSLIKGNDDLEAVFVLNRHEHWNILLEAYKKTGDEKYAARVWEEFENWYQSCPCPEIRLEQKYLKEYFDTYTDAARACWRTLEAGIRIFRVWKNIPDYLFASKSTKMEYITHFNESLLQHGEVLSKVSPILFPNADHNHFLMESFGLMVLGCVFPWLEKAEQWKKKGEIEIKRCILTQITEDGGQIEGCPHYHNESIEIMAEAVLAMKKYGIFIEEKYLVRLKKALEYTLHTIRPTGKNVAFGDSDASDKWKRTLEEGSKIFGNQQIKIPLINFQKQLGQVFVRSGWTKESASLAVICKSPVQNEHAHIDAGSFEFTAFGKTMLIDPGRYTYRECEERRLFKSAEYHNTVLINGKSPFSYIGTWTYGKQKPAYITNVNQDMIEMRQEAYFPIEHQRRIYYHLSGKTPWLLIRDEIEGLRQGEFAELYYHLDFTKVQMLENRKGICAKDVENRVSCIIEVFASGAKGDLLKGMVSDKMDCYRESRRYVCRVVSKGQKIMRVFTVVFPMKM